MQVTPLCYAAYFGFPQTYKELLQQGVRVNAKGGRYGSTTLHSAIWQDHLEAIDVLLDAGADINIEDTNGISPFEYAKMAFNFRLLQLLERCTLSHSNSGPSSRTLTT